MMDPRTAISPRCSTWYSRRYPLSTSCSINCRESTWSRRATRMGSTSSTCGPSRCTSARAGATITEREGSAVLNRHIVRSRSPIVSIEGLTRSKGNVSHAGKSSTAFAGRKFCRSADRRSASAAVGTATTMGARREAASSPARVTALAGSGTTRTVEARPRAASTPGSSRSIALSPARTAVG